jgi:hypothetical protein
MVFVDWRRPAHGLLNSCSRFARIGTFTQIAYARANVSLSSNAPNLLTYRCVAFDSSK